MKDTRLSDRLTQRFGERRLAFGQPMSEITSFRIGGPADILLKARDAGEIIDALAICRQLQEPCLLIGNGTNLLVRDGGVRGLVLALQEDFAQWAFDETVMHVESGARLTAVARAAMEHGLDGLAFASGIPGTIGGAVVMNAGAYGGEMSDLVLRAGVLTPEGAQEVWEAPRLELNYRTSVFQHSSAILLWVELQLAYGQREEIHKRMEEINRLRQEKQPLRMPSAGSAFKRPSQGYASQLIELSGLKGLSIGGAQVSPMHAGFIINTGGATARDVLDLMSRVRERVFERQGILLEGEIKVVGED